MPPYDRDKLRKEIKRFCKKHGLTFTEYKPRRGSHGTWQITTPQEHKVYRSTVPLDKREISQGVQRQMIEIAEKDLTPSPRPSTVKIEYDDGKLSIDADLRKLREEFADFLRRLLNRR